MARRARHGHAGGPRGASQRGAGRARDLDDRAAGGAPAERAVADERGTPRRAAAGTCALALQGGRTAARPPAGQPLTKCRCASLYAQQQCVLGRTTLGIARPFDQAGSAAAAPAEWPLCAPGCA